MKETKEVDVAGVGPKLLAHSKSAEFTARRGLVVDLFPFIFGASERMNAKAISAFLEKEQGIKLSSVTVNKALKDPAKNWNLFFDQIESAARTFAAGESVPMKDFLLGRSIYSNRLKIGWSKSLQKHWFGTRWLGLRAFCGQSGM